jgi:hypothetical protein
MLQRLPKLAEVALFAVLALVCAAIVALSPRQDSAIFFASVPLFLVCAWMGLRRKAERSRLQAEVIESEELLP